MNIIDALGFIGLTLLLTAFVLNQLGKLHANAFWYHMMNAVGGYILTWYAVILENIPFIILEFVWGSVALYRIVTFKNSHESERLEEKTE
ncbi:MAG: hypothetical protein K9M49_09830 [Candidatus Marinimicrobia bacterium]|nr:hypothetical protein [Candidatus Neomarinimicrobiota bacterium]MCF7850039.1 hypothetical protein [Candidatus Neomarinimicrobiota bacterium]MCF7905433.1 hypothetical protein [Candidatus Neomarinimicrobiota bacterium]